MTRLLQGLLVAALAGRVIAGPAIDVPRGAPPPGTPPAKETPMKIQEHGSGTWSPGLTAAEQETLFAIARDTLAWCVQPARGAFPFKGYPLTQKLKEPTATFVTLKIDGDLRGCIGSLAPEEPLYLSVHHNAVNAALHDYRFEPVSARDAGRLTVSVSILSPIREIPEPSAFTLGAHGIILTKGSARAVFLPEVAVEQHWTREDTLTHLSLKAGLPPDAWRRNARFQVFESVVLSVAGAAP